MSAHIASFAGAARAAQRLALLAAILIASAPSARAAVPLSPAFLYQGRLVDDGSPADGSYDFQFTLFDAATAGSPIGSTVSLTAVAVNDGLFTVSLDFSESPFAGDARWLEIAVRPAGVGAYATLSPRQPLSPAPYSIYALHAPWAGLLGMPAGFADGIDNVGGLVLPYAASQADAGTLFSITNTGAGRAIDAASSGGVAIQATSPGNGIALLGIGTVIGSTGSGAFDAAGLRGEATNAAGQTYGVRGETLSTTLNASGVRGLASAATGATNGVWGTTASSTDIAAGVFGQALAATGVTYGVLGQNASGTAASAAIRADASNAAPAGPTYGLRAQNVGGLDVVRGALGFASSALVVRTYGVQGQTNSGGPYASGVYGLGNNPTPVQIYGVRGQNNSTLDAAAGVLCQGNGVAGPGAPNAAALEVSNGAIRVSGPVRPAGTVCPPPPIGWEPIESCVSGDPYPHTHIIGWYADFPLANPLIIAGGCPPTVGSIIQVTVETEFPPPPCTSWYVQIHSKAAGGCTIRVSRMGVDVAAGCVPPSEPFWVHYVIINPAPPGMSPDAAGVADIEPLPVEQATK
ncbi:hypothetical protein RAS1_35440 [Phycisphaerae bacterium RAS1]|nr:hypothetical protein RAS1_35440 [Phycisphaerae bacterium RAS1]